MPSPIDEPEAQLDVLLERALALPVAQRPQFLQALEDRDPSTACELQELIEAYEASPRVLTQPPSLEGEDLVERDGEEVTGLRDALIGKQLGPFQILAHLGSGGVGEVFEAEQARPRRRVALKVLSPHRWGRNAAVRFREEAETLARLDHPGIARVLGAGTTAVVGVELSWMAVELIEEAAPLTTYARSHDLDLEDRVRLILAVGRALHHAHRKGVLHRDLKPANLLVGAPSEGEPPGPKVIDFGLARVTTPLSEVEQQRTRAGELMGTLRYMSPEQCQGDPALLDVASDLYALGVVAYEVFSGELPYDLKDQSLVSTLRIIQEVPARDLRTVAPEVPADLAAIVAKCLAKQPEERYDSAADLAADLERWLNHEPVHARSTSWLRRVTLFARRRRSLFLSLVASGVAASAALAVILALYLDNRRTLVRMQAAEEREGQARMQLSGLQLRLYQLDESFVDSFVQSTRAAEAQAQELEAKQEALREGLRQLDELAAALEFDAVSAADLAEAYLHIGLLQGRAWQASREEVAVSRPAFEKAVAHWRRVVELQPASEEAQEGLRKALTHWVGSFRKAQLYEEGRAHADELVAMARRRLSQDQPTSPQVLALIGALWTRGDLHINLDRDLGLRDTEEAALWCDRLLELDVTEHEHWDAHAWTAFRLGAWVVLEDAERAYGHFHQAMISGQQAVELALWAGEEEAFGEYTESCFDIFLWSEIRARRERDPASVRVELERVAAWGGDLLRRAPRFAPWQSVTRVFAALVEELPGAAERNAWVERLRQSYRVLDEERARRLLLQSVQAIEDYQLQGAQVSTLLQALRDERFLEAGDWFSDS